MRPIVTDKVAWSVCRSCLSVCRSITLVSPAKTAVPIEMLFGLRTRVGPRSHVLDRRPDPHGKGNFDGGRAAHCKVSGHSAVICAKTDRDAVWVVGMDGPKESCIRCRTDHPWEGAIWGDRGAHCKVWGLSAMSCAKTVE